MVIRALGVGHDGDFDRRFLVAERPPHIIFVAELPGAVFVAAGQFLGGLVTDLHVIDAGLDVRLVDRLDELVVELMVVHQSAVADREIHHLDLGR